MSLARFLALALPLSLVCALAACMPKAPPPPAVERRPEPRASFDGVRITFVANSGFIIEAGGRKILVDSFPGYGLLGPDILEKAQNAQPPFDRVDLVLVTHKHDDHFNARIAMKYLSNNPRAVLASSSQVAALLYGFEDRVFVLAAEPGKSASRELGGCHVEAYSLPHDGGRIENLGFLVEAGGRRFFFTGDLDMPPLDLEALAAYGLADRHIDFAFIQHFYLDDAPASRRLVSEIAGKARIVPTHYVWTTPALDRDAIRKVYPEAILFQDGLESWLMPEAIDKPRPCWLRLADLPAAHYIGEAAFLDGKIHIVGGRGVKGENATTHYVYNPGNNTWTQAANLLWARANLALASYGDKLYAFGGDAFKDSLEIYDPIKDVWAPGAKMMKGRQHVDCGVVDGRIYVIGGLEGWKKLSSRNEAYDPATNTWEAKADLPTPRHAATVETFDGKIYVFGGAGDEASIWADRATVEVYDPSTDSWEKRRDMPRPRFKAASAVVGGKIILIGGVDGTDSRNSVNSVDIYDPARDAWHHAGEYPTELMFSSVVSDAGKVYVMGGCDKDFHPYAAAMRWDAFALSPLR